MRYNIEGADGTTGRDVSINVEADSEEQAEAQAASSGILVSKVYPAKVKGAPLSYASHAEAQSAPRYRAIVKGARLLDVFAIIANALGLLAVVCGVGVGILVGGTSGNKLIGVSIAAVGLAYAIILFVVAAFLKMQGALALAVRDIAINTSRIKP